jgi:hypothetical protein
MTVKGKPSPNIHWTDLEREQVISHGVDLLMQSGLMPSFDDMQSVLPRSRQRPFAKNVSTQFRKLARERYVQQQKEAEQREMERDKAYAEQQIAAEQAAQQAAPAPAPVETKRDGRSGRKIVRWTEVEREAVMKEGVRLLRLNGHADIVLAQMILPEHRRRSFANAGNASIVNREIREAVQRFPIEPVVAPAVEAPVVEEPAAVEVQPLLHDDDPPPRAIDVLADAIVATSADIIGRILTHESVRTAIASLITSMFIPSSQPQHAEQETAAATQPPRDPVTGFVKPLPRVLIAGLEPRQIEDVKERYGSKLDLAFWKKDQSTHSLKRLAKDADVVIGITKFISHPMDQSMMATAKERYVRHAYGVSALLPRLETIVKQGPAAVKTNTH